MQPVVQGVTRAYLHYCVRDQIAASVIYGRVMLVSVVVVRGRHSNLPPKSHGPLPGDSPQHRGGAP